MTGNQYSHRPIVLIAIFEARPETRVELTHRLTQLVARSRAEPGCLRYELHVDQFDPHRLVFIESWADEGALAAHDATEHVTAIRADVPGLTATPLVVHRLCAIR